MKNIRKKDIRSQFENALNLIVLDLKIKPSKKVSLLLKNASKKIGTTVKAELKKQEAAEKKALKKEMKEAKRAAKKNKTKSITVG